MLRGVWQRKCGMNSPLKDHTAVCSNPTYNVGVTQTHTPTHTQYTKKFRGLYNTSKIYIYIFIYICLYMYVRMYVYFCELLKKNCLKEGPGIKAGDPEYREEG